MEYTICVIDFLAGHEGDAFLVPGRFEVCKEGRLDVGAFKFWVVSPNYMETVMKVEGAGTFAEGLYSRCSPMSNHFLIEGGIIILREFDEKRIKEILEDLLGVSDASSDEELVSDLEDVFPLAWDPPTRPRVIDCAGVQTEEEFWDLYAEGRQASFGKNLDAFEDSLWGGPGYPGDERIKIINSASLKTIWDGKFYKELKRILRRTPLIDLE